MGFFCCGLLLFRVVGSGEFLQFAAVAQLRGVAAQQEVRHRHRRQ
jgi:hypothetical protein